MQPELPNNINNNPSKNESKDEIFKTYEQGNKILSLIKKPNYFFSSLKKFIAMKQNTVSKNSRNQYYLINFDWFKKYYNFCKSDESLCEYNYPHEIDNKSIIIEDNSALKIDDDNKIYFNNNLEIDKSICVVIKELWIKLQKLFGGGPEYEIIYQPDKNINNLKSTGVYINLLFIKNKIKDIEENDKIDDFIHIEHIYLDINDKVKYLEKYINNILKKYKNNFFSKAQFDNPKENINYRLWLYSSFYGKPKEIAEFIKNQIIKLKKYNFLLDENNLIKWNKFDELFLYKFRIILLSFFENNIIKDIFPNRYNQYFNCKNELESLKNEDEHSIPFFTIIIEEYPFSFKTEDTIYRYGSCEKCNLKKITYNACECKNCFFCLDFCEKNYKERKNTHYINCKVHIMSIFTKENKNYYHKNFNNNKITFPLIGLANLGNTCYMNSSLQCLRTIKELTEYFLDYFDEDKLNKNNLMGTGGFLALAYSNYIYKINSDLGDKNFLELKNFKYAIGITDDRFAGYDQQDTHEFLSFLIDSIHEDLNKVKTKPTINRKSSDWEKKYDSSSKVDKLKSKMEWNNFLKRNQSIMVDLFYGQYKTSIICPQCSHNSTNFSIFLSLQLPIPFSNNYFPIKVYLYEEWLNKSDYIYLEIILRKDNNKVIIAKKIIGKILGISPYQIEIYKTTKNEINKVYNNDDELNENINIIRAVKINLKTIKDLDNYLEENTINYKNLEKIVENKIDDYISFVKNINDKNNNNSSDDDDDCNIIIDINEENVENVNKINYEAYSLQRFIIKHYSFSQQKKIISNGVIHKDFLIYAKTNQSCYELYLQIFSVYSSIFMQKELEINIINDLEEINQNREEIKHYFDKLFKKHLEEENNNFIEKDIFDIYPELPFILKLKVYKSKESKFIPNSKKIKFKKFLNLRVEKENKNNEIKNKSNDNMKSYEESKEDSLFKIEINNSIQPNINDNKSLSNKSNDHNISTQNYKNYDPCISLENQDKQNLTKLKKDLSFNNKEKENKNNNNNSNMVHSIIIIFNSKYLNKNGNDEYSLTNLNLKKIDLSPLFKVAHQNFEKISINKCFEEFTKVQTLDENNLYMCPKCKIDIAAKNKIELYKIPKILIIHLKRFENGQKIKTFIDFPINNLDISPFISRSSPHHSNPSIKYDLFAVSNHYGELEYGHYDANCLNYVDHKWYNFNDKKVEIIENNDPDLIVTRNAYVLFYRQRKMENINWDYIYNKEYKDIKDDNLIDSINGSEVKVNSNNIIKNKYIIKSSVIELEEDEDEKELELNEEISLNGLVYNPFAPYYLKLKRRRTKEKY